MPTTNRNQNTDMPETSIWARRRPGLKRTATGSTQTSPPWHRIVTPPSASFPLTACGKRLRGSGERTRSVLAPADGPACRTCLRSVETETEAETTTEGSPASAPSVTPAQQRVLDLLAAQGSGWVMAQTNPAVGTVHAGSARALQDKGLVAIWQRRYGIEAVLPGSERDHDVDGIGR